jgi:acetyltransferase-like isoleucine patch superfamily enzyme
MSQSLPDTKPDTNVEAPPAVEPRKSLRKYLATSPDLIPTIVRKIYLGVTRFSLPAPRIIVRPMLWIYLAVQSIWLFFLRVFFVEPLFKAYCTKYGRNFNTGAYMPWIMGKGDIIIGDDVIIGGKIVVCFAARYSNRPRLVIGNNVRIAHDQMFVVAREISIGDNCRISTQCWIADSNGHSSEFDPTTGKHKPPDANDVRPVILGKNVWLGRNCLLFPGVKIGEGAIISAGSVVRGHIPAYSVAGGNPAKVILRLKRPSTTEKTDVPVPDPANARATEEAPAESQLSEPSTVS